MNTVELLLVKLLFLLRQVRWHGTNRVATLLMCDSSLIVTLSFVIEICGQLYLFVIFHLKAILERVLPILKTTLKHSSWRRLIDVLNDGLSDLNSL